MSDLLPTFTYSEHRPTSKYRRDSGTRRTVVRSLDFEAFSRFVDKVKSPGLRLQWALPTFIAIVLGSYTAAYRLPAG
jgi:hypothetical protein